MGFIPFTFVDFIDIMLVAIIMFAIYRAMRGTSAPYIMAGIFIIYLVWILVRTFNLVLLSTILGQIISVGVIAILIVFQPEIRHFLQAIGRQRSKFRFIGRFFNTNRHKTSLDLQPVVTACREMGAQKTGALIIIKQSNDLRRHRGERNSDRREGVDGTARKHIFQERSSARRRRVKSGDRVIAAKCVLPVTQQDVPKSYGMRHRAALGMSEVSDAIIIAVSEETGGISIAHDPPLPPRQRAGPPAQAIHKNPKQ